MKPTTPLSDFEQGSRWTVLRCDIEFLCYQWTVNVLSDHPRWMFKKNSMEFFAGLQPYLYYYYSGCTLESHDHMFFPECSMITWPCHVIWLYWVPTLFISLFYCMLWGFGLSVQMHGKPFPVWGSHNTKVYVVCREQWRERYIGWYACKVLYGEVQWRVIEHSCLITP